MKNRAPNKSLVKLPHTEKACIAVSGGSRWVSIYTHWFFFCSNVPAQVPPSKLELRTARSPPSKRTPRLSLAAKFQRLIDCSHQSGSLASGTINNGKALAELWTFLCVQLLLWLTSEHVSHHQDNKVFNRKGTAAPPRGAVRATMANSYKWISQTSSHSP